MASMSLCVHPAPVHGLVLEGSWRYLEHDWVARKGMYVFEPPGEIHTLVVGSDITGFDAYTGPLTLATDSTIGVDSGTSLTIGSRLGLAGIGNITDNGANLALTKELTGTLILASQNFYGGNADWDGGGKNWYAYRNATLPADGWKFICWDSERTLAGTNDNITGVAKLYH